MGMSGGGNGTVRPQTPEQQALNRQRAGPIINTGGVQNTGPTLGMQQSGGRGSILGALGQSFQAAQYNPAQFGQQPGPIDPNVVAGRGFGVMHTQENQARADQAQPMYQTLFQGNALASQGPISATMIEPSAQQYAPMLPAAQQYRPQQTYDQRDTVAKVMARMARNRGL